MARIVREGDGRHHVTGGIGSAAFPDEGVDVGGAGLCEGIHADAVERHDEHSLGTVAFLGFDTLCLSGDGGDHGGAERQACGQAGLAEVSS